MRRLRRLVRSPARAVARRPHHVGAAALATGLASCTSTTAVVAIAVIAAAALVAARALGTALLASALIFAGAGLGTTRLHAIDAPLAAAVRAGHADGRAIVLERPRPERFASSAALELVTGPAAGARVLGRLRNGRPWPGGGSAGTEVRVRGPLSAPRPRHRRGARGRRYLRHGAASQRHRGRAGPD